MAEDFAHLDLVEKGLEPIHFIAIHWVLTSQLSLETVVDGQHAQQHEDFCVRVLTLHQSLHDVLDHFKVCVLVSIGLDKDFVCRLKKMINDPNLRARIEQKIWKESVTHTHLH